MVNGFPSLIYIELIIKKVKVFFSINNLTTILVANLVTVAPLTSQIEQGYYEIHPA
jgi:hypothetical protein